MTNEIFGQPQAPGFQHQPAPRRTTVTVLSLLTAALLVTTGVLAALFVSASRDRDATVTRLADRAERLATARDQVAATDAERERAEERNGTLESANAELAECFDAVQEYLWHSSAGAETDAALDLMFAECE